MLRKTLFVFRLAGQDLRANLAIHLVALAIISAAFLTVGVFLLMATNLRSLIQSWEQKIQVTVFLEDRITERQQADLIASLRSRPEVEKVEFVSKEEALANFKAELGKDAELLAGLDYNPLPASLVLSLAEPARKPERAQLLAGELMAWPGVEEVDWGESWLSGFSSGLRLLTVALMVLAGLIILAVVFIIENTLRLSMFSRKEEIGIMNMVGASVLLIRLPFMLEGLLQGLLAAALSGLGLWVLFWAGLRGLEGHGLLAGFRPVFLSFSTLLGMILAGAFLGALASMTRFSTFLRE